MSELLQLQFFQNALWASVLSAIVCGIIGAYIVVRRIVFISGGITHSSFAGLGLGIYLGLNPIFMAGVAAILSACGIQRLSKSGTIREDSAIATVWAVGMAIGILFITLTPGYATGLSSYLFGNILLVSSSELWSLGILSSLLITLILRYYRTILYSIFDTDFAEIRGIKAHRWNMWMLLLVSISLVMCIRLVGIMLLMSLLTLAQSTMSLFTSDFRKIIIGSILLNLITNILGLLISNLLGSISPGVIVVLLLFIILGIAQSYQHLYRSLHP